MKKSVLKSVLAAIAVVMMSCTTTANAQTGNTKYIYGQNDTNTTVYTLNEDGKTLTRKLKYEYKHDDLFQVTVKIICIHTLFHFASSLFQIRHRIGSVTKVQWSSSSASSAIRFRIFCIRLSSSALCLAQS